MILSVVYISSTDGPLIREAKGFVLHLSHSLS